MGLGPLLFLRPAPLFSLQGSGYFSFAPTSAKDQKQKTYPGTAEVKVPRVGALVGMERGSWGGLTLADLKSFLHSREVNKRLQDLRSCLSPKQHQDQDHLRQEDEVVLVEGPTFPQSSRLFQLKIRCRADLVRLPVRMVSACRAYGRRVPGTACWGTVASGWKGLCLLCPLFSGTACHTFAFAGVFVWIVFSSLSLLFLENFPPIFQGSS